MRSPNFFASISISVVVAFALCAPKVSSAQYSINTIAGGGPNGFTAASTSMGYPESIAFDSAGNAYIAESYESQILKVSPDGTVVTVVAGNGTSGYSGDGGPATSAALNGPQGVFIDGSGNIFIADSQNSLIREVVASTGVIQTVAGNFTAGAGYSGDGGLATQAQLDTPASVFVDGSGNIFIADFGNSIIREVLNSTGFIQTVAGTPATPGYVDGVKATNAELDLPEGVFLDSAGNIFIADSYNDVIRVVNTGTLPISIDGSPTIQPGYIQTLVGTPYTYELGACQTSLTATYLCLPTGIFVDSSDDIYIADNNNFVIREFTAAGTISTVAGTLGSECGTYLTNGCGNGASAIASTAQLNYPNGVYVNSAGDIFIADTEDFVVREVVTNIMTFAGNGFQAFSGDNGSPTNAELNAPGGVFVDGSGNIYIADTYNSVIRFINNGTSTVTIAGVAIEPGDIGTVAGNGIACPLSFTLAQCGDTGLAISANLNFPAGVFVDTAGDIFIADTGNNAIRKVAVSTNDITTVAGTGTPGFSGDTGLATQAELNAPFGVFVDSAGNIFIADTDNDVIREVTASNGNINTVAGTGGQDCNPPNSTCGDGAGATSTGALLSYPAGVFVDASENIYIADTSDNRIREVTASNGFINTVAGTGNEGFAGDGAAAISAELDAPYGVWVDTSGDIFIADSENAAIREVVAATGFIQTIAGIPANNGFPTPGFSGDDGPATSAELDAPSSVFGTSTGQLFIADTDNSRIRELAPAALTVTMAPTTATVVVNAIQQYVATVTGNANTAVNWFVNGVAGGNATFGTISTTGLFTAPATVPASPTVTIAAVSEVDNTTTGSASATIVSPSTTNSIAVTPTPIQVYTGTTQAFSATDNSAATTGVTWYVEGAQGGDATFGTVDTSGNYTAPATVPSPATIVVEAVLQADSTAIGTASVTIVLAPSAASPAPQTVSPGGTANFSVSLKANTGIPNQPITLSCLSSSLPSGATCAFSPTTVTPASSPVPFTLAVTVPSASASLRQSRPRWLGPQLCVAFLPLAGLFLLGKKLRNQRWLWLALLSIFLLTLIACGGGSGATTPTSNSYVIQVQGTTTTQPKPVTITTATLTVQ